MKVLNAGDSIAPEKLAEHVSAEVPFLYIRKEKLERHMRNCDLALAKLLKAPEVTLVAKVAATVSHGDEIVNFLKTVGISSRSVDHAVSFAESARDLAKQLRLTKNEQISSFLQDLSNVEHGVATCMLASILSEAMQFTSSKSTHVIGLSGLLHDIGLQGMSEKIQEEDESKLSGEELRLFQSHPMAGAKILAQVGPIDPAVVQAVLQHHERRNRLGFPNRPMNTSINQVAEIVGICEELLIQVRKTKTDPRLDPLAQMEIRAYEGFSLPVANAFSASFLRR
jgi:HD-GYP domain-containing protein (c-di-GMP phosphodiesterase class II)